MSQQKEKQGNDSQERVACRVPSTSSLLLFCHARLAATNLMVESLPVVFTGPKNFAQRTAAALANSSSSAWLKCWVLRRKTSSRKAISVMLPLLLVRARMPEKACSTPDVEQPHPKARLNAFLSSPWGWWFRRFESFKARLRAAFHAMRGSKPADSNLCCAIGWKSANCSAKESSSNSKSCDSFWTLSAIVFSSAVWLWRWLSRSLMGVKWKIDSDCKISKYGNSAATTSCANLTQELNRFKQLHTITANCCRGNHQDASPPCPRRVFLASPRLSRHAPCSRSLSQHHWQTILLSASQIAAPIGLSFQTWLFLNPGVWSVADFPPLRPPAYPWAPRFPQKASQGMSYLRGQLFHVSFPRADPWNASVQHIGPHCIDDRRLIGMHALVLRKPGHSSLPFGEDPFWELPRRLHHSSPASMKACVKPNLTWHGTNGEVDRTSTLKRLQRGKAPWFQLLLFRNKGQGRSLVVAIGLAKVFITRGMAAGSSSTFKSCTSGRSHRPRPRHRSSRHTLCKMGASHGIRCAPRRWAG